MATTSAPVAKPMSRVTCPAGEGLGEDVLSLSGAAEGEPGSRRRVRHAEEGLGIGSEPGSERDQGEERPEQEQPEPRLAVVPEQSKRAGHRSALGSSQIVTRSTAKLATKTAMVMVRKIPCIRA